MVGGLLSDRRRPGQVYWQRSWRIYKQSNCHQVPYDSKVEVDEVFLIENECALLGIDRFIKSKGPYFAA